MYCKENLLSYDDNWVRSFLNQFSNFRLQYVLLSIYFYFFAEEDLDKLLIKVREREMDVD